MKIKTITAEQFAIELDKLGKFEWKNMFESDSYISLNGKRFNYCNWISIFPGVPDDVWERATRIVTHKQSL